MLRAGGDVGIVHHRLLYAGLFALGTGQWRVRTPAGFQFATQLGLGYHHTFLDGPVYARRNGEVQVIRDRGRPGFMQLLEFGLGWNVRGIGLTPLVRIGGTSRYPANGIWLPSFHALVGLEFDA